MAMNMTSRQRLLTALRRGTPDRVPVTAYEFSHLNDTRPRDEPGYAALIKLQRELGETFVFHYADFGLGVGESEVLTEGPADLDKPQRRTVTLHTPKGDLVAISRRDPGNITWWQIKAFCATPEDCRKWLSCPTRPFTPDVSGVLRIQRELGEEGLPVVGCGDVLIHVCGLFHYDDFALTLLDDEGLILAMMDAVHERLARGLRAVAPLLKDVCFRLAGPEYAGAPLLNPRRHFPKLVVDYCRDLIPIINDSGNYSLIHCHGLLRDLLDYFIELAPTALEPLEVLPAGTADVTMAELKARLGGRMCLMGGIQANELEHLPLTELDARLREVIATAAAGGGYVMLPTSAPIEYPLHPRLVERYRMYFEAAHKYGRYA